MCTAQKWRVRIISCTRRDTGLHYICEVANTTKRNVKQCSESRCLLGTSSPSATTQISNMGQNSRQDSSKLGQHWHDEHSFSSQEEATQDYVSGWVWTWVHGRRYNMCLRYLPVRAESNYLHEKKLCHTLLYLGGHTVTIVIIVISTNSQIMSSLHFDDHDCDQECW